jgi:hypothetical protein
MDKVHVEFVAKAKADVAGWDCDEMYPEPKEIDLGVPNWLGSITRVATKGFEIYNQVKKFIPGGSKAGAGNVPGGPNPGELLELASIDWGEAKEVATGLGKKLLDDIISNEKSKADSMTKRRAIW